jgi:hypothetical protein
VDFEQFIKSSADQYRMYPSEKVWRGINNNLRPRKRWYGLGFLLLLVSGGLSGLFIINSKKTDLQEMDLNTTVSSAPVKSLSGLPLTQSSDLAIVKPLTQLNILPGIQQQNTSSDFIQKISSQQPLITSFIDIAAVENEVEIPKVSFANQATDQDEYFMGPAIVSTQQKNKTVSIPLSLLSKNPLTIESVLNSYKKGKRNKITFQAFFTPTISYRKLRDNKKFTPTRPVNIPYGYAALYNINEVVTHKPDMGLEIGINAKYGITRGIRAKAGLQFNMTKYEIKAFNNPLEIATIALNNGYRVDSLNTFSNYRNFSGTKANWLKNFYFQISMPVGIEAKLLGDDKIEFGIASTIQPTYILGDRAYLISSNYKNYSEVPWLIRRWNINTSLETYVAYSTGKLNWQVGPQVRYQLLSSFVKKYPVKENLFDFGFKVGIGLNK